jgi:serine/threonine-protein kinase
VVHRDATPHNIFLTYAGQVKVVDFGIAKALSSSTETRTGVLKGKIAYMAPEQALGEAIDRRVDIFAMGMVLWEVLAGRRPFKGVEDVAVIQKIVAGAIPSPRTVKPDIPELLERICMKAIAHARDDRYATATEMAATIEDAVEQLGLKGTPRDAGRVIEAFFAQDREGLKRLIEAQVAKVREGGGDGEPHTTGGSSPRLPIVDAPTMEATATAMLGAPASTSVSGRRTYSGVGNGIGGTESRRRSESPSKPESSHPSSLTAATAPPSALPPPARGRVVGAVAALVIGGIAAVGFVASRDRGASPAAASTAPAVDAPKMRNVLIDSTPQGASVREGDKELGKTPMMLPIDPTAPARRLVLALDGYTPHTFLPTGDDVRIVVPLAQATAAHTEPAPASAAAAAAVGTLPPASAPEKGAHPAAHTLPPPAAPAPKPPAATPALDINMAR